MQFINTVHYVELNRNGTPKWLLCPHHLGLKDIGSCEKEKALTDFKKNNQ